jgi:Domain of unknown function DUF29
MSARQDELYETDILLWSEQQAELLRRHAAGERANDAAIDWLNIAEEIDCVGREQLHAVESLLVQALRYMLKAEGWPLHRDAPSWRVDAIGFREEAERRYAPSMRERIDLARLWRQAVRALPETVDGQPPLPMPQACPVTLEELLAEPTE